jgi:hypothetical protein
MNKPDPSPGNESVDEPSQTASTKSAKHDLKDSEKDYPVADVQSKVSFGDLFDGSKFWLLTLACMILAIGLVWWSLPARGIEVVIHFPEGHGLEAEDVVRFRGIDVGQVEKVSLNPKLDAVDVTVQLKPFAKSLAREGTRFWIVRPELSIRGISGLDTAVGHKYVGLIPGEEGGSFQSEFRGLEDSPPDALSENGIELIFRGEKSHSVVSGSPVTFRGVEIGRILSVGLSSDSRYVDVRARIYQKFKQLVTTNTKVWANSGVNIDFKFGQGLMLNTESLETIARGGVSLLTIRNGGKPIQSGHVFVLNAKPEPEWFESANNFRASKFELRGAMPLLLKWTSSARILGGPKESMVSGIPFRTRNGETALLVPGDVYGTPRKLEAGSMRIGPAGSNAAVKIEPNDELRAQPMVKLSIPKDMASSKLDASSDFRIPEQAEDCIAVRGSLPGSSSDYVHYSIDAVSVGENWELVNFTGDVELWHGTPVLSNQDGKVIGMLLVTGRGRAEIARINSALLD